MNEQFFGKPFRLVLAILAGVFLLSVLVFKTPFAAVVLGLTVVGVFLLSFRNLAWGLAAAFAELFANSHGHLVDASIGGFHLSLRMAVFAGVMAAWMVLLIMRRVQTPWSDPRLSWFLPLFAAVAIGGVIGVAEGNPARAFQDGNAYLYLGYILPILSVRWTPETRRILLQTFAAGAVWVGILTFGLLYLFTHIPRGALAPVYTFIRDTRTGELTDMGGIFRIFLQAQMSVVAAAIVIALVPVIQKLTGRRLWTWIGLASVVTGTLIIGLSRSFWMGLIVTAPVLGILVWKVLRVPFGRIVKTAAWYGVALISGAVLIVAILLVPPRSGDVGAWSFLLSNRTTGTDDVAISSRWNLLPEMMKEIAKSPVLGSGFGKEVTFKTDDPRARAINPDGTWTTYSFEWGWLDLWLKMGILGPLAFLILFVYLIQGLRPMFKGEQAWLSVVFVSQLVMLYTVHFFSPYLNHPLGLGLILFMLPFIPRPEPRKSEVVEAKPLTVAMPTPVLSMKMEE